MFVKQDKVSNNLAKSFEKAYVNGIYADTPQNRKLGRVGQSYATTPDFDPEKGEGPMKVKMKMGAVGIELTEDRIDEKYTIKHCEDGWYLTSNTGYDSSGAGEYEQDPTPLMYLAKKFIKNYFTDRSEDPPKGW